MKRGDWLIWGVLICYICLLFVFGIHSFHQFHYRIFLLILCSMSFLVAGVFKYWSG
jgi:hypothetical protein